MPPHDVTMTLPPHDVTMPLPPHDVTMTLPHNQQTLKRRRQYLRNHMTKAEITLWYYVKNKQLGYKFRRQHSIGNYIIDFYCYPLKLAVELDGEAHAYERQIQKDYIKECYLKSLGITVVRYTNAQLLFEIDRVLTHLKKVCMVLEKNINST